MQEHFLLIEDNLKIYLVKNLSFDKKRRKYLVVKYEHDKTFEVSAKNIVIDSIELESNKIEEAETLYNHKEFWSSLVLRENIVPIEDFILGAIKHYKIISYSQLNTFLISFNLDFIYYKLVDKNKVYFNSKDIVEKILHNLDMKREKEELYEDFIDSLANKKPIDFIKYDEQISQIINYLGGKPKYSRTFIESVKGVLGARSYEQLLSALKSLKVFPEDFEPLYSLLKLKKDFPYSDTEVENLTLNNSNSKDCFKAFTIDDEGTYDFDDAISIKKDDDFYSLSIYVTNFSSIFSDDSIFTKSAKDIINTIYAPSGNFNLYSKKMVNDISLVLGHERPVLSIIFKLKNFEIVSYKIEENTIQVSNNYTYMEFESLIEKNPDYNFLNEFTKYLNKNRLKNADFKYFNQEVSVKLDSGSKIVIKELPQIDSRRVVSELMILANLYFSKYFIENSLPGIFRSQKKSENLEVTIIDDSPSFCFHRKVSPVEISSKFDSHEGLGLDSYLQITSPIRRYLDSINMRQVSYFLKNKKELYSAEYIDKLLTMLLPKLSINKDKSKRVYNLWILKYLSQEKHKDITGYIYAKLKDKYIVFFNKFNFFDSVDRENCRNSYEKDDFIKLYFDDIDYQNLELTNLRD